MGEFSISEPVGFKIPSIPIERLGRIENLNPSLLIAPTGSSFSFSNSSLASIHSQPPREFRWKHFVASLALFSASVISLSVGGSSLKDCHSSPQECNGTAATGMTVGAGTLIAGGVLFYKSFR